MGHSVRLPQVRVLFSRGPFIAIFASDPHIIIKAINQNLSSVLRDSNINGHDYMRNIVHLPVFLNSRGLSGARKYLAPPTTNGDIPCPEAAGAGRAGRGAWGVGRACVRGSPSP